MVPEAVSKNPLGTRRLRGRKGPVASRDTRQEHERPDDEGDEKRRRPREEDAENPERTREQQRDRQPRGAERHGSDRPKPGSSRRDERRVEDDPEGEPDDGQHARRGEGRIGLQESERRGPQAQPPEEQEPPDPRSDARRNQRRLDEARPFCLPGQESNDPRRGARGPRAGPKQN